MVYTATALLSLSSLSLCVAVLQCAELVRFAVAASHSLARFRLPSVCELSETDLNLPTAPPHFHPRMSVEFAPLSRRRFPFPLYQEELTLSLSLSLSLSARASRESFQELTRCVHALEYIAFADK